MSKIDFDEFKKIVFDLFEDNVRQSGIESHEQVSDDYDLVENGVIDSMDLLNLAIWLKDNYRIELDFSVFGSVIDTSLGGLYSTLRSDKVGMASDVPASRKVADALARVGVGNGDILLVHSSLSTMGFVGEGPKALYEAIRGLVGEEGTILVPAANTQAFLAGKFDVNNTSVQNNLGAFSEYVRSRPGAVRSVNAFDSVAGVGPDAKAVCSGYNEDCYGEASPWKKALERGTKLVLLGVDFYYASIVHAAELECRVPYRKWLEFPSEIFDNGEKKSFVVRLYSTELGIKRYYQRIEGLPSLAGSIKKLDIQGDGMVAELDEIYKGIIQSLKENPSIFV